jgi:enamine deaminase RidA (YjgF/YER057c/UK114 family)
MTEENFSKNFPSVLKCDQPRQFDGRNCIKETRMEQRNINPWKWQDQLGFSQACEITGGQKVLYCAGQASMTAEGRPAHPGDMRAQLTQAFANLETVLAQAGFSFSNVVRLNYYTTDVDQLFANWDVVMNRLGEAGCQPSGTLLGVTRLAFPELLIEIEATAVK